MILTAGDRDGKVGLEWVRRVERRGRGNENGKGVKEGEREVIWTGSSS